MDLMTTLSAASAAIKTLKDLRDIDASFDLAELKARLASAMSDIADVKIALAAAQEELNSKDKEIAKILESFAFSADLVEYHGYKYRKFEDGKPKGMPFCPVCEQKHGRYFQLVNSKGILEQQCPSCKSIFSATTFIWEK